jgi:hypothetical protein
VSSGNFSSSPGRTKWWQAGRGVGRTAAGLLFLMNRFGLGPSIRTVGHSKKCEGSNDDRYHHVEQSRTAAFSGQHGMFRCFLKDAGLSEAGK